MRKEKLLVTGGAGFIGSHFVDAALKAGYAVFTVDKLDYCGNLLNLENALANRSHRFLKADIADTDQMREVFKNFRPDVVVHLAAQTHVDRSIDDPSVFIQNNVVATQKLLKVSVKSASVLFTFLLTRFMGRLRLTRSLLRSIAPIAPRVPMPQAKPRVR